MTSDVKAFILFLIILALAWSFVSTDGDDTPAGWCPAVPSYIC